MLGTLRIFAPPPFHFVQKNPLEDSCHATLWSNLQDWKISSRVEIPKLDRVWQKEKERVL